MVAHIKTISFEGINPIDIDVQVHLSNSGLPSFSIVGLPDKAVGESKDRVRSALSSMGLSLPPSRITINLAPADILKEGSHYDLAIALGLIISMNVIDKDCLNDYLVLGELSLDGSLSKIAGVLPAAIHASSQGRGIICPKQNGIEACWAGDIKILAADNLLSLVNHIKGNQVLTPPKIDFEESHNNLTYPDLADIKGQESAKRALEVAASGNHNILMIGPPGSGKSMLASRIAGITPALDSSEILDVSMVASVANKLIDGKAQHVRPYRSPHHSCSMAAMVGGGRKASPGEVTLAHRGILFLDELPEFPRNVLDSLRQPLETGSVTVSRAQAHVTYPADFQLVAAMNPCRCGYLGDASKSCGKAPRCGTDYQSKISGPMFDRIDLHIEVPAVSPADLRNSKNGEPSKIVAQRVAQARKVQLSRNAKYGIKTNSQLDGSSLEECTQTCDEGRKILDLAFEKMGLTMRSYNRILRVSRTIADMEESKNIKPNHIAEALNYRKIYNFS